MQLLARDNSRTPMQWDGTHAAGFTSGKPWLAVNPNYTDINVAQAEADPSSVLAFYRALIQMRKDHPIMVYGTYRDLALHDPYLYIYERELEGEVWRIVLNVHDEPMQTAFVLSQDKLLVSNYPDVSDELRPYEARVYRYAVTEQN